MNSISFTVLALSRIYAAGMDIESLPWFELEERVSGNQVIDTSPQVYLDECYPEYTKFPTSERDRYDLIDQPSGLCMFSLFCGFKQCTPEPDFLSDKINLLDYHVKSLPLTAFPDISPEQLDEEQNKLFGDTDGNSLAEMMEEWMDPNNLSYNIPAKVLFPKNAGDVVAAVEFAKTHGVEISIKNSGHSYTGSSTKANTLLMNMKQYKRYASDDKEMMGIIECNGIDDTAAEVMSGTSEGVDLDKELCRLVLARGKLAAIRVGGGENFDMAYRSIHDFNEKEGNKYHMVGGALGTVSPMGWTWQGGLAGTSGGRVFGFGVDQVLQIEAVLPNGEHVRFGPTSWEEDKGFVVPRTTKVSGVCNKNPEDNEVNWVWEACPEETDEMFDDLWFAFRGGGGGTWGVVLSVYLQLHDYLPFQVVSATEECMSTIYNASDTSLLELLAEFSIDFYLDPDKVHILREQSDACGSAMGNTIDKFFCFSNEPMEDTLIASWQYFVIENSARLSDEVTFIAPNCLEATNFKSYTEWLLSISQHEGNTQTNTPTYGSTYEWGTPLLLPKSWILKNKQVLVDRIKAEPDQMYWAFGGNAEFAHDQATSLSPAHREAGAMVNMQLDGGVGSTFPWVDILPQIYNFTSGGIPSYSDYNHLGPYAHGPLKGNLLTPCPVGNFTHTEARTLCHSPQETVFGTESLERLESIKKKVDPNGMFDCFRCVGNSGEFESEFFLDQLEVEDSGASADHFLVVFAALAAMMIVLI